MGLYMMSYNGQLNGPFSNLPFFQYLTQNREYVDFNLLCLKVMG
jgi:hypothetical protein